jgi:hypothetical protein
MQSYGAFLSAVKVALRLYRDDLGAEFPNDIFALLSSLTTDDAFKRKHSDIVSNYDAHTVNPKLVTLSEVTEITRWTCPHF